MESAPVFLTAFYPIPSASIRQQQLPQQQQQRQQQQQQQQALLLRLMSQHPCLVTGWVRLIKNNQGRINRKYLLLKKVEQIYYYGT
jgi:hypothetical protein